MISLKQYKKITEIPCYTSSNFNVTSTDLGIDPISKMNAQLTFKEATLLCHAVHYICICIVEDKKSRKEFVLTTANGNIIFFNATESLDDSYDVILSNGLKLKYVPGMIYEP